MTEWRVRKKCIRYNKLFDHVKEDEGGKKKGCQKMSQAMR